jgi:hypothetical protein
MSSLVLASDTLAGTPSIGAFEYNGKILTYTPQANTQRGIVPNELFYRLDSGLAGANVNTAQNLFGVGVTLAGATVYEFEIPILLQKTAGTTSHTIAIGFGGSATLNNIFYHLQGTASSSAAYAINGSAYTSGLIATASSTVVSIAFTSASMNFWTILKGTVSVNAGGTFIPQYTLSAAPGGAYTTAAGSYIKLKPIGTSGTNTSVGTWA